MKDFSDEIEVDVAITCTIECYFCGGSDMTEYDEEGFVRRRFYESMTEQGWQWLLWENDAEAVACPKCVLKHSGWAKLTAEERDAWEMPT